MTDDTSRERENPFTPIDMDERLSGRRRSRRSRSHSMMQPGQLYRAPEEDAPAPRADGFAAPDYAFPPKERPSHEEAEIPPYLKKQPVLNPFTPYRPGEPYGGGVVHGPGERIASTFRQPMVKDEIAAFFTEPAREEPPSPPPVPAAPSMEEECLPPFPPEKGKGEDYRLPSYEEAILPESAELPDTVRENPNYQPPAYEFFSTERGGADLSGEAPYVRETPPPVPAYTPRPPEETPAPPRIRETFSSAASQPAAMPAPKTGGKPAPAPPQRKPRRETENKPPLRWGRIAAAIACGIMLVFCGVVGGQMLFRLTQNEREMKALMSEYEKNGLSLRNDSNRVDLPPPGETLNPGNASTARTLAPGSDDSPTDIVESIGGDENASPDGETQTEPSARTPLTRYPHNSLRNIVESMQAIHKEYPDVVGRLTIPGVLEEYVVFRDNTYYLSRNYRGASVEGGAVFMDENGSLQTPPENLLLRGRGDVAGRAFAPLWQYRDGGQAFVSTAYTASLTTLYEEESYVLLAVILQDSDPAKAGYFDFSSHGTFATDEEMTAYASAAMERSLYRFSTDLRPSDRLLTLATVSGGTDEQCLALIFRMKREGE